MKTNTTPEPWRTPLGSYITHLQSGADRKLTVRLRRCQLEHFARAFPKGPRSVRERALVAWLADQDWAIETRRSNRAALRGFFTWALERHIVEVDPTRRLPTLPKVEHLPHPVPDDVLEAVLAGSLDERSLLIMELGLGQGLRRSEIARVHTRDVMCVGGTWWLIVHGKGGRGRQLPLWPVLARWLLAGGPGWVFPGRIDGHLSPDHVGELMHRALGSGWGAHSLRHHFACRMYKETQDIFLVQKFLGHADIKTTLVYAKMPDERMCEGLAALGGPLPSLAREASTTG